LGDIVCGALDVGGVHNGGLHKYDSLSRVLLESKRAMRVRGAKSPDEWYAVALTFAEPVGPERSAFDRKLEYPKLWIA
jgi:hypothetical protein